MSQTSKRVCRECNQYKHEDGFPNAYSRCWQCHWTTHLAKEHPEVVKKIRKRAKQRMREHIQKRKKDDILDHVVYADDRDVLKKAMGR